MKILIRPRRWGKTTEAVKWVKEGVKTDSYPGWSRVLLVPDRTMADATRRTFDLDYRQVFSFDEWRDAHLGRKPVDVAIDNLDIIVDRWLSRNVGPRSPIAFATCTEEPFGERA